MNKQTMIAAAIGGLLTLSMGASLLAADEAADSEKCYGVAKAGKNDCAGAAHACAGQSKQDGSPTEWLKLPSGTCEKIVGGSLTPKK